MFWGVFALLYLVIDKSPPQRVLGFQALKYQDGNSHNAKLKALKWYSTNE